MRVVTPEIITRSKSFGFTLKITRNPFSFLLMESILHQIDFVAINSRHVIPRALLPNDILVSRSECETVLS